ncbi:MAG TPA: hypothetical protein VGN91_30210 [Bosea sp. (in: a-proteobacteria)]|nr:hypothetical protein [Bosea sp. (in: a-proteobacteria)]
MAAGAPDDIIARSGIDDIVPGAAIDIVIAGESPDLVPLARPAKCIASNRSYDLCHESAPLNRSPRWNAK